MSQKEHLLDIIKLIWQKRKTIIYACLIAMVGSVIISLLLPDIFKSETVFYAANPSLGNPSSLSENNKSINQYGTNKDLDRLFTIAESSELFNALNSKYDFFKHYDLDPTIPKAKTKLRNKFNKHLILLKTEYDAFSLSFEDKDPAFSSEVANEARNLVDKIAQSVIKSSQKTQINTFSTNITNQKKYLQILLDTLTKVKNKYQIFNVEAQEEVMAELATKTRFNIQNYTSKVDYYTHTRKNRDSLRKYQTLLTTKSSEAIHMATNLSSFNKGANQVNFIEKEIKSLSEQLNLSSERLKQLEVSFATPFKAIHLVEKAFIPDNKHRPKRSIYVLATVFFTLIFTILALIVLHTFKSVDWKEILSD